MFLVRWLAAEAEAGLVPFSHGVSLARIIVNWKEWGLHIIDYKTKTKVFFLVLLFFSSLSFAYLIAGTRGNGRYQGAA